MCYSFKGLKTHIQSLSDMIMNFMSLPFNKSPSPVYFLSIKLFLLRHFFLVLHRTYVVIFLNFFVALRASCPETEPAPEVKKLTSANEVLQLVVSWA